jgi:hypothetical protein
MKASTAMDKVITKKPCGRCGGSGKYSFNLMDLDKCYGCGGTGWVAMAPKGQKKIKPTAELRNAVIGDIVENAKVLYRVDRIVWIKTRFKGHFWINQQLHVTRLVDDKQFFLYREAHKMNYGALWVNTDPTTGKKTYKPTSSAIETPEALIGTDVAPDFAAMTEQERQDGIAAWVARGYNAEDFE